MTLGVTAIVRFAVLCELVLASAAIAAPTTPGRPPTRPPVAPPVAGATKVVDRLQAPLGCDRITIKDGLPSSTVQSIVQDKLGFLWFGTPDGLARYDGNQLRVYRSNDQDPNSVSGGYVTALTLDGSGKLWVGTADHGVSLYDPETDQFTRIVASKTANGLSSEGVV
ncbi:MAG: two-component regulator propeller domain-containing protein, partial [Rhodoglobus sp.]